MKKRTLILLSVVVLGVTFLLGRTSARATLAESAQGQAPVNCSIPKINGTLKGVTAFTGGGAFNPYLVFEDATGMIRIMDDRCNVAYKFSRQ